MNPVLVKYLFLELSRALWQALGCSTVRRVTCWVPGLHTECCSDPGTAQPEMGFLHSALWVVPSECSWEGAWQCHTQVPWQCHTECSNLNKPEKPNRRLLICAKFWKCWSTDFRPRQHFQLPGTIHVPGLSLPSLQHSETSAPGWAGNRTREKL